MAVFSAINLTIYNYFRWLFAFISDIAKECKRKREREGEKERGRVRGKMGKKSS